MNPATSPAARLTAGFTLIELMVAVAVLAILSAIALPSFRDMWVERRLRAAAEAVQADLMFARSEAVRRNAPVHVLVASGANGCLRLSTAVCTSCRPDATDAQCAPSSRIKVLDLAPAGGDFLGVQVSAVSATDFQITPVRGAPSVASPSLTVSTTTAPTRSVTVTLSPLGLPSACTATGNVAGVVAC